MPVTAIVNRNRGSGKSTLCHAHGGMVSLYLPQAVSDSAANIHPPIPDR